MFVLINLRDVWGEKWILYMKYKVFFILGLFCQVKVQMRCRDFVFDVRFKVFFFCLCGNEYDLGKRFALCEIVFQEKEINV